MRPDPPQRKAARFWRCDAPSGPPVPFTRHPRIVDGWIVIEWAPEPVHPKAPVSQLAHVEAVDPDGDPVEVALRIDDGGTGPFGMPIIEVEILRVRDGRRRG